MRKRFWKGLRPLELGVIFCLIVIVMMVIFFRYPEFKCRSIGSEAKFALHEIYAAEMRFHEDYNTFASVRKLVEDERIKPSQKYFSFSDGYAPTTERFSILAIGVENSPVEGEIWSINQEHDLKLINKVCKK